MSHALPLNQQSCIDYILVSAINDLTYFEVLDPEINFSDHLPLACNVSISVLTAPMRLLISPGFSYSQLRWDKAHRTAYYLNTGRYLQPHVNAFVAPKWG